VVDDHQRPRAERGGLGEERQEEARRAERRDLREKNEDMRIGLLEEPEAARVEPAAQIDQDVVEGRLHDLDDLLEVLQGHPEVGLRTGGCREHIEP
jgi:hypothetical protein